MKTHAQVCDEPGVTPAFFIDPGRDQPEVGSACNDGCAVPGKLAFGGKRTPQSSIQDNPHFQVVQCQIVFFSVCLPRCLRASIQLRLGDRNPTLLQLLSRFFERYHRHDLRPFLSLVFGFHHAPRP